MKKNTGVKARKVSRIVESLREAVAWVQGNDVGVRVSAVEVPIVDVKETWD